MLLNPDVRFQTVKNIVIRTKSRILPYSYILKEILLIEKNEPNRQWYSTAIYIFQTIVHTVRRFQIIQQIAIILQYTLRSRKRYNAHENKIKLCRVKKKTFHT